MNNLVTNAEWRGGFPGNAGVQNAANYGTGPLDWRLCDVPAEQVCQCVQCKGRYTHAQHLLTWRNELACRFEETQAQSLEHGWNLRAPDGSFPFPEGWGVVAGWTCLKNDEIQWRMSAEGFELMARSALSHVEGQRQQNTPQGFKWQIGRGIAWDCLRVRPRELKDGGEDGWKCVRRVAHFGRSDYSTQDLEPSPAAPLYRGENAILLRTQTELGQKAEVFQTLGQPVTGTEGHITAVFCPGSDEFYQHFELRTPTLENLIFEFSHKECAIRLPGNERFRYPFLIPLEKGTWYSVRLDCLREETNQQWEYMVSLYAQTQKGWSLLKDGHLPHAGTPGLSWTGLGFGVERHGMEFGTVYWKRIRVHG